MYRPLFFLCLFIKYNREAYDFAQNQMEMLETLLFLASIKGNKQTNNTKSIVGNYYYLFDMPNACPARVRPLKKHFNLPCEKRFV